MSAGFQHRGPGCHREAAPWRQGLAALSLALCKLLSLVGNPDFHLITTEKRAEAPRREQRGAHDRWLPARRKPEAEEQGRARWRGKGGDLVNPRRRDAPGSQGFQQAPRRELPRGTAGLPGPATAAHWKKKN